MDDEMFAICIMRPGIARQFNIDSQKQALNQVTLITQWVNKLVMGTRQ